MADNRFRPKKFGRVIPQAITIFLPERGTAFHGWEDLTVTKNLENIAHGFTFRIPRSLNRQDLLQTLTPGTKISISVNNEPVMLGRIERQDLDLGAEDKRMQISGRSLAGDLIDATVEGINELKNIPFKSFAEKLVSPFGIKVFESVTPDPIGKIAIKPGETVFEVLDKAARLQGYFWISTRAGNIRLTRAGRGRAISKIEEDVNMLSGSINIDASERFSNYTVKGQASGSDSFPGVNASSGEGKASDSGVTRNRPLTIIAEGNVDNKLAKQRAEWEATTRLAKSTRIGIVVQGWLQQEETLWGLNQLIYVKSPTLGIEGDFLSTTIEHVRSNGEGTVTRIGLTRQDAYTPAPVITDTGRGGNSLEAIVALSQSN